MAKLARAVFVRDPAKHQDILLRAGETPAPQYAVLVTNPACWEGGKLPAAVKKHLAGDGEKDGGGNGDGATGQDGANGGAPDGTADLQSDDEQPDQGDDSDDTKPAAKRAARKPARGRTAAAEGTDGQ
ncbi:hypothetical protein E6R18_25080 [Streptomyces sp. A1277]|uniref:hypothetical protein n=1 Tax=Streptomyces sp. A1277 TaxID=2563103 RepID=UPI0010A28B18|nr:hypothetical protein [Streptomyces sp. A1277]THA29188.1 hypothetical protein E6R18_25080 [Streptomyces sp. A1277]